MNLIDRQPSQVPARLLDGPLRPFLAGASVVEATTGKHAAPLANDLSTGQAVLAYRLLQDVADYRSMLRTWFDRVEVGGHLVVVVPQAFLYERQLALPSPWRPQQTRLYTPASLLLEVEEALMPNAYRVRWAGDLDGGYDYAQRPSSEPQGNCDAALVIERIVPVSWSLDRQIIPAGMVVQQRPDFAFEPVHTRFELGIRSPVKRILVLKLDHLGDFVMGIPALAALHSYFAEATIDLVVGPWNASMARELGIANRVIAFDALPRNPSEEQLDATTVLGRLRDLIVEDYDLAIDLRTDADTRHLLQAVNATIKAGIGTRSRFPYLTIALPLDESRHDNERAWERRIEPSQFSAQIACKRSHFAVHADKDLVRRCDAIIWGPYFELDPGEYIFEFHLDFASIDEPGELKVDISLDAGVTTAAESVVIESSTFQLPFRVDRPRSPFEARIWLAKEDHAASFTFYGGRLICKARGNVLHQSEYIALLVELIRLRVRDLDSIVELSST